jgi:hypothetical protein
MKAVTMVQQHPPTPPSGNIELQYDLHHLVNHNTGHHYHHDYREAQYLGRQGSAYGSPCPMMQEVGLQQSGEHFQTQQFESGLYPDPHGGEFGLGIQYVRPRWRNYGRRVLMSCVGWVWSASKLFPT